MIKWLLSLLFTLPPDFRQEALKEIEDGPQREFYEKLSEHDRKGYLKELTQQHSFEWLCKSMSLANIVTRVTFVAVIFLYAHAGLLGPLFKWGSSALQTSVSVLRSAWTGTG
jgi:hypothetical protein